MAVHIQSGKNNVLTNKLHAKVQSIPCSIQADSDAKVSQYFEPTVRSSGDGLLSASFRGFPLKGKDVELPKDYVGVVLHENIRPVTDKEERRVYLIHKFNSFRYWNWDKVPSKNDVFLKALDWIDIAEALHAPVVEE